MQKEVENPKEIGLVCITCEGNLVHQNTSPMDGPGGVIKEQFECSGCWKDYDIYRKEDTVLSIHIPISGRA